VRRGIASPLSSLVSSLSVISYKAAPGAHFREFVKRLRIPGRAMDWSWGEAAEAGCTRRAVSSQTTGGKSPRVSATRSGRTRRVEAGPRPRERSDRRSYTNLVCKPKTLDTTALFHKTGHGVRVGDLLMSLIHTS
jgi:hypothetical protein